MSCVLYAVLDRAAADDGPPHDGTGPHAMTAAPQQCEGAGIRWTKPDPGLLREILAGLQQLS